MAAEFAQLLVESAAPRKARPKSVKASLNYEIIKNAGVSLESLEEPAAPQAITVSRADIDILLVPAMLACARRCDDALVLCSVRLMEALQASRRSRRRCWSTWRTLNWPSDSALCWSSQPYSTRTRTVER